MPIYKLNTRKRSAGIDLENPRDKRFKYFGSSCETVDIIIGRAKQRFRIGIDGLKATSKMFQTALTPPWTEPYKSHLDTTIDNEVDCSVGRLAMEEARLIDLTFIGPKNLSMYLEFLRTGTMENSAYLLDRPDQGEEDDIDYGVHTTHNFLAVATLKGLEEGPEMHAVNLLLQAYVTADFLQAESYQNAVIDELVKLFRFLWKSLGIVAVYPLNTVWNSSTVDISSPLRQVFLDLIFAKLTWSTVLQAIHQGLVPYEMALELAAIGFGRAREDDFHALAPWQRDPCGYHRHSEKVLRKRFSDSTSTCYIPPPWDSRYEWDETDEMMTELMQQNKAVTSYTNQRLEEVPLTKSPSLIAVSRLCNKIED